jgi:hypothetical protein
MLRNVQALHEECGREPPPLLRKQRRKWDEVMKTLSQGG